jgi:hypothetical protein
MFFFFFCYTSLLHFCSGATTPTIIVPFLLCFELLINLPSFVSTDLVPSKDFYSFTRTERLVFPSAHDNIALEKRLQDLMLHERGLKQLIQIFHSLDSSPHLHHQHIGRTILPPNGMRPFTQFITPESVDLVNGSYYKAFPYITGEGFKFLCDHIQECGNLGYFTPHHLSWSRVTNRSLVYWPLVFNANSIHLLQTTLRTNKVHFFLLAHNQDASFLPFWLLEDPHVLKIFVVNSKRSIPHPKVIGLPLGIRAYGRQYPLQLNQARIVAAQRPPTQPLYVRLGLNSLKQANSPKAEHRLSVIHMLRSNGLVIAKNATLWRPFKLYALDMATHRFILSPRGVGQDAHRTWEALYVGRVPLVENILPPEVYRDLPVRIVRHWKYTSAQSLNRTWRQMLTQKYNLDKLWMPWWIHAILCECLLTM